MTGHCNLNCPSETFSMATRDDLARFDGGFKGLTNRTSLLAIQRVARIAHLDVGREIRKGLPEIILAEGKAPQEVAEIVEAMVKTTGRAIVSRATGKHLRLIRARRIPKSRIQLFERSGIILAKFKSYRVKQTGGRVGLLTAGTLDIPVIGVPTSRSYGFGDRGIAALAAMLQSCSLGIAVVNIDGGVGAGSVGALIANRAAKYRAGKIVRPI